MAGSVAASRIHLLPSSPNTRRVPVRVRKAPRKRRAAASPVLFGGPSYSGLSHEAWNDLNRIRHIISFPAAATVFVEGQACRGVYILRHGRAKLAIANSDGKTLVVRIAGPGEILALNSCLTGEPHEVTLETTEPTEFAFVHAQEFLQFLGKHREASFLAGAQLVRDCLGAYEFVRSVGFGQTITARLARFLLHWAAESPTGDRGHYLKAHFTHDEIGQMIGATRETVTRTLGLLRRHHVIEFSRSGLLIRDILALQQMVN